MEKGFIMVNKKRIIIEGHDYEITHVNIFGASYELPDETLIEDLQVYGTIVSKCRGHYLNHPEVENGIRHWWMLLHRPVPGVVRVGAVRLSIKYKGQPDFFHNVTSTGSPRETPPPKHPTPTQRG